MFGDIISFDWLVNSINDDEGKVTKNSSENVEPFLPPLHLASAGGRGVVRVRHLGRYHALTLVLQKVPSEGS